MNVEHTDVLVVGAGVAGLTATALLARQGVSTITLCKYASTADGPRAHITNQRTLEVMRDLGLESRVYDEGQKIEEVPDIIWTTSLAGRELARRPAWGTRVDRKADYDGSSPCTMVNIGQHVLEPILLEGALARGADVRFNNNLVDVTQDADGVTATVRHRLTGEICEVRAKYLVGADGGRSTVATQGASKSTATASSDTPSTSTSKPISHTWSPTDPPRSTGRTTPVVSTSSAPVC